MYKTLFEQKRDELVNTISKQYYKNKMPYHFYRLIDICLCEYNMNEDVIAELFNAAYDIRKHYYQNTMEMMAREWFLAGVENVIEAKRLEERRAQLERAKHARTYYRKECDNYVCSRVCSKAYNW